MINFLFVILNYSAAYAEKPLVSMLTYNSPDEHNVLQSLLCLKPCSSGRCGEMQEFGKSYENTFLKAVIIDDLKESDATIQSLNILKPDFLSMSGHHSSGFSGTQGEFYFDKISNKFKSDEVHSALMSPKVVLLNGCYTDVTSEFEQNPIEYIQHIVTETEVRSDTVSRFRSAISQISGFQKHYERVFPQACIMGYEGKSIPGGVPQIYMQYTNYFRALYEISFNKILNSKFKILSGNYKQIEAQILNECPDGKWPCNLCDVDPEYYSKFSKALALYLKQEKKRVDQKRSHTDYWGTDFVKKLTNNRFYKNTGWSCKQSSDSQKPIIPKQLSRSKNAKILLQALFWVQDSSLSVEDKASLSEEALHGVRFIKLNDEELAEIKSFVSTNKKSLDDVKSLPLSPQALEQYYYLAQSFDCDLCIDFIRSSEQFKLVPIEHQKAFIKTFNESTPISFYKTILQLQDKRLSSMAALRMSPSAHSELYKDIFNSTEEIAVAAARSLSNGEGIPDDILINAIRSKYQQVRVITSYYISPASSKAVVDEALNSPHSDDFSASWSSYLQEDLLF